MKGPFQPILNVFPKSKFGSKQRSFQQSWYKLFPWLEYSPKENLAFCFPCRMFSGVTGLNSGQHEQIKQNLRKKKIKKSLFVHYYGHCLNIILVDSIGKLNKIAFDFFGNIQLIYNFIEGSCTRHAVFKTISNITNT